MTFEFSVGALASQLSPFLLRKHGMQQTNKNSASISGCRQGKFGKYFRMSARKIRQVFVDVGKKIRQGQLGKYLYCSVLFSTVQYCAVLFSIVQYCSVLFSIVQYCTLLYSTAQYCSILFSTVQYCSALYSTVRYCSVLFSTVQYC